MALTGYTIIIAFLIAAAVVSELLARG